VNIFVTLELFLESDEVTFYTIRQSINDVDEELSETEKFITRFQDTEHEYYEEFAILLKLIEQIGERGAHSRYFRQEDKAEALPSKPKEVDDLIIKVDSKLRLYCIRLSQNVVVLCNGGVKTKDGAEYCPNVSSHFRFANSIAKRLWAELGDDNIKIVNKHLETDYDDLGFQLI
jgi:hypothetical protein